MDEENDMQGWAYVEELEHRFQEENNCQDDDFNYEED